MRKEGKSVMWRLAAASLFALGSANAQQQPPPATPVQLAADAASQAAANQVWHDAWRANVEAHLRTVAARGTPRDLLVAGWLWPAEADVARIEAQGSFARPQARAWIQEAYTAARGDDPLVDWTLLHACAATGATCDRDRLLQRLMTADPGNAELLLMAYQDAVVRKDSVAADRYWRMAAEGTHHRSRINDLGALMLSALREAPAPPLEPAMAATMGDDLGLGRAATPQDLAGLTVMSLNTAFAMPTLYPIVQRCRAELGRLPADALSACKRIYTLLATDEATLLGPRIALPRLVEWAGSDDERRNAQERLRRFAWVYENVLRQYQRPATERRTRVDYLERVFRDGEIAAMRDQLQLNGIATEPPAGWLPDNPEWHAWLPEPSPAAH